MRFQAVFVIHHVFTPHSPISRRRSRSGRRQAKKHRCPVEYVTCEFVAGGIHCSIHLFTGRYSFPFLKVSFAYAASMMPKVFLAFGGAVFVLVGQRFHPSKEIIQQRIRFPNEWSQRDSLFSYRASHLECGGFFVGRGSSIYLKARSRFGSSSQLQGCGQADIGGEAVFRKCG